MLLLGVFFTFDAMLGLTYLNRFSALATATVVVVSLLGGSGYGVLVGHRITRNLREKGIFTPSRREILLLVLAATVTVAGFLWLLVTIGAVFLNLMMIVIYWLLSASFVAEGLVLLRWERRTGRKVEYEGLWAVKAQPQP
jgi:hypothetical protein